MVGTIHLKHGPLLEYGLKTVEMVEEKAARNTNKRSETRAERTEAKMWLEVTWWIRRRAKIRGKGRVRTRPDARRWKRAGPGIVIRKTQLVAEVRKHS